MRKLTLKLVRSRGLSDSLEVAPLPDRAQDLREPVSWSHRAPGPHLQALRPCGSPGSLPEKACHSASTCSVRLVPLRLAHGRAETNRSHAAIVCLLVGYY